MYWGNGQGERVAMNRTANQVKHDKKHSLPEKQSCPDTSKIQIAGRMVAMTRTTIK